MGFKKFRPSLTSNAAKFAWLWKHRNSWEHVPMNVLNDRWSGAGQSLVDLAKAEGLYRETTPGRDVHSWLLRKIKRLRKDLKARPWS